MDYTDEGIIINKTNGSGKSMVYYGCNNYNVGETTIHFKSKDENVLTKYIYYLLLFNQEEIRNLYQGVAQKVISKTNLKSINIPFPPLERQKELVKY